MSAGERTSSALDITRNPFENIELDDDFDYDYDDYEDDNDDDFAQLLPLEMDDGDIHFDRRQKQQTHRSWVTTKDTLKLVLILLIGVLIGGLFLSSSSSSSSSSSRPGEGETNKENTIAATATNSIGTCAEFNSQRQSSFEDLLLAFQDPNVASYSCEPQIPPQPHSNSPPTSTGDNDDVNDPHHHKGVTVCACHNPTDPIPMNQRSWNSKFEESKQRATNASRQFPAPHDNDNDDDDGEQQQMLDVVLIGDSIMEHWNDIGRSKLKENAQVFQELFTTKGGGKINGVSLGVGGERVSTFFFFFSWECWPVLYFTFSHPKRFDLCVCCFLFWFVFVWRCDLCPSLVGWLVDWPLYFQFYILVVPQYTLQITERTFGRLASKSILDFDRHKRYWIGQVFGRRSGGWKYCHCTGTPTATTHRDYCH
jgi:hypothetical protein